ncbi:MAG: hypothetical protein ACT4N8_12980 [Sphingosinicella sp.]|uniref:hypothetical protein n=1 Tax=Sphingosinicella sp. TaxID=1917971 RepID=UPI00403808E4
MRMKLCAATLIAAALPLQPVLAQNTILAPTGSSPPPVPAPPPADPNDGPEEIGRDAARDLRDTHFYNRPGATRAQYDADWQECRLIARGSRTPVNVGGLDAPALQGSTILNFSAETLDGSQKRPHSHSIVPGGFDV